MTRSPDQLGVVAKFLRKELHKGPVLVSGLEAMARSAGLLGEGQRITHAKVFKGAKRSLGIRSIRSGFASGGVWFWRLEKSLTHRPESRPESFPAGSRGLRVW